MPASKSASDAFCWLIFQGHGKWIFGVLFFGRYLRSPKSQPNRVVPENPFHNPDDPSQKPKLLPGDAISGFPTIRGTLLGPYLGELPFSYHQDLDSMPLRLQRVRALGVLGGSYSLPNCQEVPRKIPVLLKSWLYDGVPCQCH